LSLPGKAEIGQDVFHRYHLSLPEPFVEVMLDTLTYNQVLECIVRLGPVWL
jgi:hypothetical protein